MLKAFLDWETRVRAYVCLRALHTLHFIFPDFGVALIMTFIL